MKFQFNDGGSPFKKCGDCTVRAIAIAMERKYDEVVADLKAFAADYAETKRDKSARKLKASARERNPRYGFDHKVTRAYMESKGWRWNPTMEIGSGCRVRLTADDLPTGRIVCRVTRHLVAVVDGVINDTYDCSRGGTRCVYGYYVKA